MPTSMKLPLFLSRGIARGMKNILREHGWGTSFASLFGVLFLGQILLLLVFGVQGGLRLLEAQTDLRLQILETANDSQIQDLFQNIRQLPIVTDVVYITREQAYERQKARDPELVTFLEKFGIENPFPETIGVRLGRLTDYGAFVQFLRQPVFTKVVNPEFLSQTTDQQEQVYRLIEAVRSGQYILFFVVALLIVAILFVVTELVRRRVLCKREELFVEQLVGADRTTIMIPFCTEMICLLGVALFISFLLAAGVVWFLPVFLPVLGSSGLFSVWSVATVSELLSSLVWLLPLEITGIFFLAIIGTILALRSETSMQLLPLLPS